MDEISRSSPLKNDSPENRALIAKAETLSAGIKNLDRQIQEKEAQSNSEGVDKQRHTEEIRELKKQQNVQKQELKETVGALVPRLDFQTERNAAVFYGKEAGKEAADAFRAQPENARCQTIEQTPGGKWMDKMGLYENLSERNAENAWRAASIEYSYASSGRVNAFAKTADKDSVFWQDEVTALRNNREVTGVTHKKVQTPAIEAEQQPAEGAAGHSPALQQAPQNQYEQIQANRQQQAEREKAAQLEQQRQQQMEQEKQQRKGMDYER